MEYFYVVNLDERGEFSADLRKGNEVNGKSVWSIDTEGMRALIEDGYVKHGRDLIGLRWYLVNIVGVIGDRDTLFRRG